MDNNIYIGNRYVPLVDGEWVNNKTYEPLTIVTYGNNSYTSKKPVPLNTPPVSGGTNDPYWALTGNLNGAIAALDTRVTAIEAKIANVPTSKKFIVIGDSFGYGIKGDSSPWTTGWIDYLKSIRPNNIFCYETTDPTFEGTAAFLGTVAWLSLFDWIVANKLGTTDPGEITNVVILGGNNEPTNSQTALENYIVQTFVPHVRAVCPNAEISIGCIGVDSNLLIDRAAPAYKKACYRTGCKYISSTLFLGCLQAYNSGHGHWTNAGYEKYNPYVAEAVLFGETDYCWFETHGLTIGSDMTLQVTADCFIEFEIRPNVIRARVYTTTKYGGWIAKGTRSWSSGTYYITMFTVDGACLFPIKNGSGVAPAWALKFSTGGIIGIGNMQLMTTGYNTWEIIFNSFIQGGGSSSDMGLAWDGLDARDVGSYLE